MQIWKKVITIVLAITATLMIYHAGVWAWANTAIDELATDLPSGGTTQLTAGQVEALLKIEDPRFFEHQGIDISKGQGLTTITSSLARDVFLYGKQLDGFKGFMQAFYRSVFECCKVVDTGRDVMALVLNDHLSKQDQLKLFIDNAYFGRQNDKQIIGFSSAARVYYATEVAELSDEEFAGLVAMLLSPNTYHPTNNPEEHKLRIKRILAVVHGECNPDGWLDLTYPNCEGDA